MSRTLTTRIERSMAQDEQWFTILNRLLADMHEHNVIDQSMLSEFSTAVFKYKKYLVDYLKSHGYEDYKTEREKIYKSFYKMQQQLSLI